MSRLYTAFKRPTRRRSDQMSKIERVPIEKLAEHLEGTRRIAVEKNGKIVGFYIPRGKPPERKSFEERDWSKTDPEARRMAEELHETLQKMYASTGMTEDEFVDLLNPKIEFPYDRPDRKNES
jgi:hypothetical protein